MNELQEKPVGQLEPSRVHGIVQTRSWVLYEISMQRVPFWQSNVVLHGAQISPVEYATHSPRAISQIGVAPPQSDADWHRTH